MTVGASKELAAIIQRYSPRPRAEPTGHMRERIAVAIRGSRPNYLDWTPQEHYELFLREKPEMRQMLEEQADRLLLHFDAHDLEIVDRRRDGEHEDR